MASQRRKAAARFSDVGSRVAFYLEQLFAGNKSKMATFAGVTHTAIAKTIAGDSEPGFKLLAGLMRHAAVSAEWLMTGRGEPLRSENSGDQGVGWPVPIARELLPGPPAEHNDLVTGQVFAVAGEHFRASRFFYRVPPDHLVVEDIFEKVQQGDLILFDTDPAMVQEQDYWPKRLCVVRAPWDGKLVMGNVMADGTEQQLSLDVFELGLRKSPDAYQITIVSAPNSKPQINYEPLRRGKLPRGRKPRFHDIATNANAKVATIGPADVVAIGVLLVRPLG